MITSRRYTITTPFASCAQESSSGIAAFVRSVIAVNGDHPNIMAGEHFRSGTQLEHTAAGTERIGLPHRATWSELSNYAYADDNVGDSISSKYTGLENPFQASWQIRMINAKKKSTQKFNNWQFDHVSCRLSLENARRKQNRNQARFESMNICCWLIIERKKDRQAVGSGISCHATWFLQRY